jgi:hypothetical protein
MTIWDWLDRVRGSAKGVRRGPRTERSLRAAYSQYAAANREWLSAFRDLTVEMAPHLAVATRLRFSLQLAYLDRRDFRFEYLLETAPERLKPNGNLSEFVGAVDQGWSGDDEATLRRQRPDYDELCAMIASVKAKAEEKAEGFSEHLDAVSKSERCLALLNAFQKEAERIEREVWSR